MDTLTNDVIATRAIATLLEHQADINKCQDIMRTSCTITAHRLRTLLVPILNRWGIGWLGKHGIWTYPMVSDNTVIVPNEVVDIASSAYGLDTLHWDLFHALLVHYEASTGYLFEYMEHIPLPAPDTVSYVWVMSCYEPNAEDDGWGTMHCQGTFSCALTAMFHPLYVVGQHYHGPITPDYYQDALDSGGNSVELVQYLPTYKAGPNGTWILDRDWDEGYHYPGKVGDCC